MKQIKCNACGKNWYIDNGKEGDLKECPFCNVPVRKKIELEEPETLGEAIYHVVTQNGLEILSDMGRMAGYLYDIVPGLKKEIRIFEKSFDEKCIARYKEAFEQDLELAKGTLAIMKEIFVEEEGLSDSWADILYKNCFQAVSYYHGEGRSEIIDVEISDFNVDNIENLINMFTENEKILENMKFTENIDSNGEIEEAGISEECKELPDSAYKKGLKCEMKGDTDEAWFWYGESHYCPSYIRAARMMERRGIYRLAWKSISRAACLGDGEGLYYAGKYYQMGRHVSQDFKMAVFYYRKSAEKGYTDAYFALAKCYKNGEGIAIDEKEAARLFKIGIENILEVFFTGNQPVGISDCGDAKFYLEIIKIIMSILVLKLKKQERIFK